MGENCAFHIMHDTKHIPLQKVASLWHLQSHKYFQSLLRIDHRIDLKIRQSGQPKIERILGVEKG